MERNISEKMHSKEERIKHVEDRLEDKAEKAVVQEVVLRLNKLECASEFGTDSGVGDVSIMMEELLDEEEEEEEEEEKEEDERVVDKKGTNITVDNFTSK